MAAKFCSQCGNEVSSTAKFCPNCAAPLTVSGAFPTSNVTTHPLDTAARKSRSLLLPAAIAAVVILAVAVAVLANSRKQASLLVTLPPAAITAPAVTNTPTQAPETAPPLTNVPAQKSVTAPAVTNTPDKPAPVLPPEVTKYLNFLQGIEQKRVALNNDVSGATAMLGIAQGMQTAPAGETENDGGGTNGQDAAKQNVQKLSQGYSEYAVKWQALVREFRSMPAPPACTLLANRYLTFLSDYTTVITKMQVALLNRDSSGLPDLSAVATVQATISADGTQADGALTDLCARYGVPKPFVISPEGAAPSLLGH